MPKITAPTTEPIEIERKYIGQFPIVGKTKIPPCGARNIQLNAIVEINGK